MSDEKIEKVFEALKRSNEQDIFEIYLNNFEIIANSQIISAFLTDFMDVKRLNKLRKELNDHYVKSSNLDPIATISH